MQANRWQFRLPWQCSSTTRGASAHGAHPGLHSKPLDASIGRVPAPYHPGGRHGVKEFESDAQNTNKTQLLASNYGTFRLLVVCANFNPKTESLLRSLMRQVLFKCEMPRLELESSATFLAIKLCQRTEFGKVIKLARSSIKMRAYLRP